MTTKKQIFEKHKGKCAYCGLCLDPFDNFEMDHVIPKSKGGGNEVDNLTPACRRCNRWKGDGEPIEFRDAIFDRMFDGVANLVELAHCFFRRGNESGQRLYEVLEEAMQLLNRKGADLRFHGYDVEAHVSGVAQRVNALIEAKDDSSDPSVLH